MGTSDEVVRIVGRAKWILGVVMMVVPVAAATTIELTSAGDSGFGLRWVRWDSSPCSACCS